MNDLAGRSQWRFGSSRYRDRWGSDRAEVFHHVGDHVRHIPPPPCPRPPSGLEKTSGTTGWVQAGNGFA